MATLPNAVDTAALPSARRHTARSEGVLVRGLHLWHLLSLDAPTVAMLWTWFLARSNHIALPATAILAMGIAVWMLYAADRLLDTRSLQSTSATVTTQAELEPRHYFHRDHHRAFRLGILLASVVLALLLPRLDPQSIRLYLVLGTILFGYFVVIHINSAASPSKTTRLPKELAVGVFFSAATFIPTVARDPTLRLTQLPGAALFAVLCSLNCLFIFAWEHPASSSLCPVPTHAATSAALRLLPHLALAVAISGLVLTIAGHSLPWPISTACGLSAVLLLLLHKMRQHLSPNSLRAAADLCLLTPVLLLLL